MNLVELKKFIDAHHCSDNASWQRAVFDELFEMFSVIPIVSGVYNGNTSEEIAAERKDCDRKAAAIPKWEQFCTERNTTSSMLKNSFRRQSQKLTSPSSWP